jgi:hypothetical protein
MSSTPVAISRATSLFQFLTQPLVDGTIAFFAMVPLVYLAYYRYQHWGRGIPVVCFATGTLIAFVTMVSRRPPKRITPNPLYWLLAFVATYWPLLTLGLIQRGGPVVPRFVSDAFAICGLVVIIWAAVRCLSAKSASPLDSLRRLKARG